MTNRIDKTGSYKFYNNTALKFGGYDLPVKRVKKYPDEDPEKAFKKLLLEYAGRNKIALDLGCADGHFTLDVAPFFKEIIAIDLAEKLLELARKSQSKRKIKNVKFEMADAYSLPYSEKSFDLIYSRRGPTNHEEIARLLKKDGYFVEIRIGEQDARELKEIFSRGQMFGEWREKIIEKDKKKLEANGLNVLFAKEYFYSEYYRNFDDFCLFLSIVPIFTDFNAKKDKKFLGEYLEKFKNKKGIQLPRHRIVFGAKKK